MSITGKIASLFFDKDKTKPLFPRTKVIAISDNENRGLQDILDSKADDSKVVKTVNGLPPVNGNVQVQGGGSAGSGYTRDLLWERDELAQGEMGAENLSLPSMKDYNFVEVIVKKQRTPCSYFIDMEVPYAGCLLSTSDVFTWDTFEPGYPPSLGAQVDVYSRIITVSQDKQSLEVDYCKHAQIGNQISETEPAKIIVDTVDRSLIPDKIYGIKF